MSRDARGAGGAAEPLEIVWSADGHPDDGSLRTWIDGEFGAIAAETVSVHVDRCAQCEQDVADLRGYGAAAARLLLSLDRDVRVPAATIAPRAMTPSAVTPRIEREWWERPITRIAATTLITVGAASWMLRGTQETHRTAPEAPRVAVQTAPKALEQVPDLVAAIAAPTAQSKPTLGAARTSTALPAPTIASAPRTAAPPSDSLRAPRARVQRTPNAGRMDPALVASAVSGPMMLTGYVRDRETQRPVESASVTIDGTVIGALSDAQGQYRLLVPNAMRGDTLNIRIRRIGYGSLPVKRIANADTVTIDALLTASATLQVVTVRAEQTKLVERTVANAVATITVANPMTSLPTQGTANLAGKGVAGGVARGVEGARAGATASTPAPRASASFAHRDSTRLGGTPPGNREQYDRINDNPFLSVKGNPRSTFSTDVDRASYGNVRRFINDGNAPPPDAVRIEELVNYFPYDLPAPRGKAPVAITTETMDAPWQPKHKLVRIALQARRIETDALPPNNLVFLIDVSGSMMSPDKLPLVKASLRLLVDQLRPQDKVALVVYAGAAGLVLPSTSGSEKARITDAIERLEAGGSTAGGAGIQLAYRTSKESFLSNGNNRVILATDGDFNVGASSDGDMERLIEEKRAEGTYLTVLGFGRGNFQDAKMEKLAKRGNGNYAYVDNIAEARKTLVAEMGATLVTVANDVKLQVEFNPSTVSAYRLIGYEDRLLATEDFADDRKDAGDMGSGHSVTALYEVVPAGVRGTVTVREQDALRYEVPKADGATSRASRGELAFVNLRYKTPGDSTSVLITQPVPVRANDDPTSDFRFAASVASFGMVLRGSEYRGSSTLERALEMARESKGRDIGGYRAEFIGLVEKLDACRRSERASCQISRK